MEDSAINFWGYTPRWRWLVVWGILTILCGLYFLFQPEMAYFLIASLFGVSLLLGGVFQMFSASNNRGSKGWGWLLVAGIFDVLIGTYLVMNITISEEALPYVFALIVLYRGILNLIMAHRIYQKVKSWWMYLVNGILLILLFFVFIFFPFSSVVSLVYVSSMMMIYWGFMWVLLAIDLKPRKNVDSQ